MLSLGASFGFAPSFLSLTWNVCTEQFLLEGTAGLLSPSWLFGTWCAATKKALLLAPFGSPPSLLLSRMLFYERLIVGARFKCGKFGVGLDIRCRKPLLKG